MLSLVCVVIGVVERSGRILICRRKARAHLGRLWEFPGGKRKANESWEACLRRELREELGIAIRRPVRIWSRRYRYADRAVWLAAFRCGVARGKASALASDAIRWVAPETLPRYAFPPANGPLISQLARKGPRRRLAKMPRRSAKVVG